MSIKTRHSFLRHFASCVLPLFGGRRIRHTPEDLKRADFKTNTQRLGIRFNKKIRDVFRFRWIRKKED